MNTTYESNSQIELFYRLNLQKRNIGTAIWFVTNSLEKPDFPFELHFAHPLKRVERSNELLLIKNLGFEEHLWSLKLKKELFLILKKKYTITRAFFDKKNECQNPHEKNSEPSKLLWKTKFEDKMAKVLKIK